MFDDDDPGHGFDDAMMLGAGYALFRHGQDQQTKELLDGLANPSLTGEPVEVVVHIDDDERRDIQPVNALDFTTADMPEDWDSFIGQEKLKQQLMVSISAAKKKNKPLRHVLLASGFPGVGKTTIARLIAKTMGVKIIELVPPFNVYTLVEAAKMLDDGDVLFIDEIHKLADSGKRGAEILLKIMEDHVAYLPDGETVELNQFTLVGATTDKDKLPETVVDRFKIKPYFAPYSLPELGRIAMVFAFRHFAESQVSDMLALGIAKACRGTPRIIEEMVLAAQDLALTFGRTVGTSELLDFLEVEADGLTRTHIHYLTAMRQYHAREAPDGGTEFIAGERTMMDALRETTQGLGRVERFLVERGLIDRTARGRRLTGRGVERAEEFIAAGKGVTDV